MPAIEIDELTHIYHPGTPYERKSLDSITFSVNEGDVLGIVGENGSGKSTLIKHLNGLLLPTKGNVKVLGRDTLNKGTRRELWRDVGLVFQSPEKQIFEDMVYNEIAYGLQNLGIRKEEITCRVREALNKVGLDYESIKSVPPICLSGGLKRRVAIASILAMNPAIIVFDEPTAGLDASGCKSVIEVIRNLKKQKNKTIIMVSHNLSEMLSICTHIAVLKDGKLISFGPVREVVSSDRVWDEYNMILPEYIRLIRNLTKYTDKINTGICSLEEAEEELHNLLKGLEDEQA